VEGGPFGVKKLSGLSGGLCYSKCRGYRKKIKQGRVRQLVCESETWKIRGRYQPKSLDTFILFVHRPDQIGFSEHQTFNHHKTQHLVRKTPLVSLRSFPLPPSPPPLTLPYLTVSFPPPPPCAPIPP